MWGLFVSITHKMNELTHFKFLSFEISMTYMYYFTAIMGLAIIVLSIFYSYQMFRRRLSVIKQRVNVISGKEKALAPGLYSFDKNYNIVPATKTEKIVAFGIFLAVIISFILAYIFRDYAIPTSQKK
jgi:ABC-type phosphate/phosphonate transport system permease subunit